MPASPNALAAPPPIPPHITALISRPARSPAIAECPEPSLSITSSLTMFCPSVS